MPFRVLEYWLNATSRSATRGRTIGLYPFCFLLGIAMGSLSQPQFGTVGLTAFAAVALPILLGGALLACLPFKSPRQATSTAPMPVQKALAVVPLAMAAVICYGLYEDVPAYLLSVYTLRIGLGEDIAAYTLTAFALVMPGVTSSPTAYLMLIALWGACAGALYAVGLAMVGDHFSGQALISANAVFGTVYAAAALLGPLINGTAMQLWDPHGLLVSCALIFAAFLLISALVVLRQCGPSADNREVRG